MGLKIVITEDQYNKLLEKSSKGELKEFVAKLNLDCSDLNFDVLDEKLKKQRNGKIGHNTVLNKIDDNHIGIKYHDTNIIVVERFTNMFKINTNGYHTSTTKGRLNQILDCYDVYIYQKKGNWYIKGSNGTFDYVDGINVYDDGYVELPNYDK